MTRYRFGSSIRIPPMLTNSAEIPGSRIALIRSTRAGGNVSSIPNSTPITFIVIHQSRNVDRSHFLPLRPVVLGSESPHMQAVRDALRAEQAGGVFGVGLADVAFAGDQHPFVVPVAIEKPAVTQARQEVRRTQQVGVAVVVSVQ